MASTSTPRCGAAGAELRGVAVRHEGDRGDRRRSLGRVGGRRGAPWCRGRTWGRTANPIRSYSPARSFAPGVRAGGDPDGVPGAGRAGPRRGRGAGAGTAARRERRIPAQYAVLERRGKERKGERNVGGRSGAAPARQCARAGLDRPRGARTSGRSWRSSGRFRRATSRACSPPESPVRQKASRRGFE
jgi:hypothetical protein